MPTAYTLLARRVIAKGDGRRQRVPHHRCGRLTLSSRDKRESVYARLPDARSSAAPLRRQFAIESSRPRAPLLASRYSVEEELHVSAHNALARLAAALRGRRHSQRQRRRPSPRSSGGTRMTGANNDRVNALAKRFSDSQSDYKVTAVYKGSYPGSDGRRDRRVPRGQCASTACRCSRSGPATMMAAKGAIKPVYEVMAEAGEKFDPKAYVPAVAGYYTNAKGQMLSLPVQQLDNGVLVQQGRVREGGARSQPRAADVAGSASPRWRSSRRPGTPVRSRPAGRPGRSSRASRPGTTCRSSPRKTAFGGPTRSSCSTARSRFATSRTCRTGSRRATSSTAAARTSRKPSSTAASAR